MKNSSHVSSLLLNTSSEKVGQHIFYLSCFWQPSESDWAVSSMCFPILPYFPRKNISIFYLMCNLAPSTISQNSRCKVSLQESSPYQCLDNVLPTICVRDARKIRRKKEMRRRWRPSNRDGLYIYILYLPFWWSDDWRCLMIRKIWQEKERKGFASASFICFWQPSESDWAISSMCFPIVPHFEMKNINIFYLIRSCMCAIDSKCICHLMWLQYLLYIWLVWLGQKLFNFTHLNTAFRWPGAWKRWSPQGSGKLGGCMVMHHCSPNHSNKDHIWELIWLFAVIIKCKWWPP